jgi:hypothetical protein
MKPGDVVLIQGHGLKSVANRIGQALVSGKLTRFTHVMLCVAPGVLIDATPHDGVKLRNIVRELICGRLTDQMCSDGTVLVLRPPPGSWNANAGSALVSTLAHVGKGYNFKILLPNSSDADDQSEKAKAAFCSELVVLFLEHWGVIPAPTPQSGKTLPPSKTLPVHFNRLQGKQGWTDVTSQWAAKLKDYREWSESEQLNDGKNFGLALYQGNQQIHLLLAIKQFDTTQKSVAQKLEAIWTKHGPKKR